MRRCRHRWSVLCTKAPPPLLAEGAAARRGLRIRVGASMGPRSTPRVPGNRKAAHPCPAAIGNRSPRRILHPTSIASTLAGAEPWNRREARVAALSPLCRPVPKGNDSGPRRFVRDDPTPSAVGGCPVTSPAEGRAHTRTGIRRQAKRDPWRFSTRRFKISELLAWLLSPRRRGWHMALQPHIDDDVPVVFVVVATLNIRIAPRTVLAGPIPTPAVMSITRLKLASVVCSYARSQSASESFSAFTRAAFEA